MNKAILLGNVGREPETRSTPSGMTILGFSVATSEKWKDKNTQQAQEKTEWHNIKVFGKQADNLSKMLKKGAQVFIEGRIQTNSWEKDGVKRYMTEIVANNVQLLGKKEVVNDYESARAQGGQDEIPF